MKLADYNYLLDESLISSKPPDKRGSSRLLVLNRETGDLCDKRYMNIPDYLSEGDVLVLNNSRVIKARLKTIKKDSGVERELVVLEKHSFDNDWHRHKVLYRRKLRKGDVLVVGDAEIVVDEIEDNGVAVVKSSEDLLKLTSKHGEVPLPPYMRRDATPMDVERYQTVWAESKGSVAAPTASLNMTGDILDEIRKKGVQIVYVTLHVGLGTFLPIRTNSLEDHKMHQEYFEIPSETVAAIKNAKLSGKKVFALGTSVARTLEYASEQINISASGITGEADIFIYPGYKFKMVDGLITNFHAPKSTVLMMAAAFAGWDKLMNAYDHAMDERYSFLSYGDSMLII